MKTFSFAALAALLAAGASAPASAKYNCDEGYKGFMMKLSTHVGEIGETDLSALMRRGLSVLDACNAGDNFVPEGAWNQVIFDMEKMTKKKS